MALRSRLSALLALALLPLAPLPHPARAENPGSPPPLALVTKAGAATDGRAALATMPVSELRPGMTGYGLTVFSGTRPERFPVRIVGVLRKYLPQMDLILIRCEDPRIEHSGVAAGMSGSPIYINDRLIGALAYGWNFSKDPVAGVTPIENMLAELHRPRREPPRPLTAQATATTATAATAATATTASPLVGAEPRLVPAAMPIATAGLTPGALAWLSESLAPFHMTALQASGGGSGEAAKSPLGFEPGGPIAVQLIRGDISAAGTGTVTLVEGSQLMAFGHSMYNAGELSAPIATAEVVHILSALTGSFKMASPLVEKGSLIRDRETGIIGDVSERSAMVPVTIIVRTPGRPAQALRTEVARHRFLTPLLANAVATSAVQSLAPDIADAVVQIDSKLEVKGFPLLSQSDHLYAAEGLSAKALAGSTGMKQLQELLGNPFEPVQVERLSIDVSVAYRAEVADVVALSLQSDELEPDTRPSLYVTLRAYGGKTLVRAVPIEIPRALAGQTLKIEAAAGPLVKPEQAPPERLAELVENLRRGYSARSLVVTLSTPDEGVMMRGRLIPSLPASVIATLRPGSTSRRGDPYKRVSRAVVDLGTVLQGKQELTVQVKDDSR